MHKIRNASKKFGMLIGLGVAAASQAVAAVPTEISDITTNADTVFTTVKGIIVAVVGFSVLIGFVKLVKKK
jgi:hypothetical protein